MDRRDFMKGLAATTAGAGTLSGLGVLPALADGHEAAEKAAPASESEAALAELQQTLRDLEMGFLDPAWRLQPGDFPEARRYIAHVLQHATEAWLEPEPAYPAFIRFVTPEKKLLGDNPDAVYFTTPISAAHEYRIRGNVADATYTSVTVEQAAPDGVGSGPLGATLNDKEIEIASDGSYEIVASAKEQPGNWLHLGADAVSITTRHYYERERSVAADRLHHIPIMIETTSPVPPRPTPTDASAAAGLRRVSAFMRKVITPPLPPELAPSFSSIIPNQLPPPLREGSNEEVGFAAKDNVYSMAPFLVKPGEALIIRGRFPKCRFANIVLWNRFIQTLDYTTRQVSLNRKQVKPEADGSFKIVLAATDPGVPNWLDTEGRVFGMMFWRFLLPEEDIEPLTTKVVPIAEAAKA